MLATLSASRGNDGLQAAAAASNWLSMDAVDPQVARSVGGAAHVLQQQLAFVVAVLRRQLEEAEADLATLQWQQNAYLASPGMFMAALERGNLQVCHTTATMHPHWDFGRQRRQHGDEHELRFRAARSASMHA